VAVVPAALAGCGGSTTVTETVTVTVTTPVPSSLGTPARWQSFGHIASLMSAQGHYVMRFDPALFLSGETANKAAVEDGVIAAGDSVPNDNYKVDESKRLYTYIVPPNAKVTVIANDGQLGSSPITVAELAKIVDGTSATKLFEPLDTGVWITIRGDRVLAIDQQYVP
jgi:hypothetical protein